MKGSLAFPWTYGVVLTHISRRQFDAAGLSQAIEGHEARDGIEADTSRRVRRAKGGRERLLGMLASRPARGRESPAPGPTMAKFANVSQMAGTIERSPWEP